MEYIVRRGIKLLGTFKCKVQIAPQPSSARRRPRRSQSALHSCMGAHLQMGCRICESRNRITCRVRSWQRQAKIHTACGELDCCRSTRLTVSALILKGWHMLTQDIEVLPLIRDSALWTMGSDSADIDWEAAWKRRIDQLPGHNKGSGTPLLPP